MTNPTPRPPFLEMHDDADWSAIDRYFGGEACAAEADAIERWAQAAPENARLLDLVRRGWTEAGVVRPAVDEARAWEALQARVESAGRTRRAARPLRLVPPTMLRKRTMSPRARALAAGILVAVAAGGIAWWQGTAPEAAAGPGREYVTAKGQRSEVTLIDGTRVWLSVDSRLRVPAAYGMGARDVELEGEAFFVVAHDARRPFRVHTPTSVSEDLGTEFSVRHYADDTSVVVVVVAGKVALRPAGGRASGREDVELIRGQMGRLDESGRIVVVDGVDLGALHAWRQGRIEFEEEPLGEAMRRLERWFDIEVTLGDSALARVPITASFAGQSADEALTVLAGALDLSVTRHGRQVRLSASPGPTR